MGFMGQIGPNMGQNMGFMDFMGRVDTLLSTLLELGQIFVSVFSFLFSFYYCFFSNVQ